LLFNCKNYKKIAIINTIKKVLENNMTPEEPDRQSIQEIQEELLLTYFVGKYPQKTTRKDLTKAFPDLVQKHDIENVFSTAKKLANELPVITVFLSSSRTISDRLMAQEFGVSRNFVRATGMIIENGKLGWDKKDVKELYNKKHPQPTPIREEPKEQSLQKPIQHPPKKLLNAILQKLPSSDKLSIKALRSALQKHKTGTSKENTEIKIFSSRKSTTEYRNPMRRESNGKGPSGPGM
jgi:hypothetical protein